MALNLDDFLNTVDYSVLDEMDVETKLIMDTINSESTDFISDLLDTLSDDIKSKKCTEIDIADNMVTSYFDDNIELPCLRYEFVESYITKVEDKLLDVNSLEQKPADTTNLRNKKTTSIGENLAVMRQNQKKQVNGKNRTKSSGPKNSKKQNEKASTSSPIQTLAQCSSTSVQLQNSYDTNNGTDWNNRKCQDFQYTKNLQIPHQNICANTTSNPYIKRMAVSEGPLYCWCQRISCGQMIACDSTDCPHGWFHVDCVGLTADAIPLGKWYCMLCYNNMSIRPYAL